MRWLVFVFALFPFLASAEILYVRPVSGEYSAEDGSNYANAFDGFADVTQGSGAGQLGPGDTLYICGDHDQQFTSTVNGTSASHISVRFDCPGDPGLIDRASVAGTVGVYINGHTYWDIYGSGDANNPDISNVENAIIHNDSAGDGTTLNGGSINNVVIDGCVTAAQSCIFIRGISASTTGLRITNGAGDGLHGLGKGQTHTNNYVANISTGGTSGDCYQFSGPIDGLVLDNNICDHSNKLSKYCVIASGVTDSGTYLIKRLTCTQASSGSCTGGPAGTYLESTGRVEGSTFYYGCYGIHHVGNNQTASGNIVVGQQQAGIITGGSSTGQIIQFNTVYNTPIGIDIGSNNATNKVINNIVSTTTTACVEKQGSSVVEQYNDLYSCGTDTVTENGVTASAGTGTITTNPALDSSYDISSTSPAWSTGIYAYPWRGKSGKCSGTVINIGATCALPVPYGYTIKPQKRARR